MFVASPESAVIPLHRVEQRDRHSECCVKERESRPGKKTEYGISDAELCLDRGQQDRQYLPVDEIESVDNDEHAECISSHRLAARHSTYCAALSIAGPMLPASGRRGSEYPR